MSFRPERCSLNAYDVHKLLINEYVLTQKGSTALLKRDTSKDKTDKDTVRENLRFLWDEDKDPIDTWGKQLAKKYYDKLYKEYCIGDLSLYKENKVGLRWRTEDEVISGKGQFICGAKKCNENEELRTWEVNFKYVEFGETKNALVKIRLCERCSKKLNYHWKRKELKRLRKSNSNMEVPKLQPPSSLELQNSALIQGKGIEPEATCSKQTTEPKLIDTYNAWKDKTNPVESNDDKTQEEEMDDFLADLFM